MWIHPLLRKSLTISIYPTDNDRSKHNKFSTLGACCLRMCQMEPEILVHRKTVNHSTDLFPLRSIFINF